MRKTSHDGGDSTSITSGVENEIMKPILSILKPKKTSLKRKPPSTCKEVDETVVEPLLGQDREKPGTSQSAKYFTKSKTDTNNDKIGDKSKLLGDNNIQNPISSAIITTANITLPSNDRYVPKPTISAPIHNHMNTNVFNSHESNKIAVTTKSQILVEIDSSKPSAYSPSPLIFTTAKIHADGKTKHMEPVQVTPVPILSTVELNLSKNGTTNEKKVATTNNGTSLISTVYNTGMISKTTTHHSNAVTLATPNNTGTCKPVVANANKTTTSNIIDSTLNDQTTSSNEKKNKGENTTSNQKAKDGPISTTVVSMNPATAEQTKAINAAKFTNPVIEPIKATVSAINQVEPNQSKKQSDKSLKTPITTSNTIDSVLHNQKTSSNEEKNENANNNQKRTEGPIPKPVVSTNSSTAEQTKALTAVKSSHPVIEPIKPTVSAINQVELNQSNKQSDKTLTDKIKSNSESTQVIDYKLKDSTQANKSNPTNPTTPIKPNTFSNSAKKIGGSDNKQLQRQKSVAVEDTPRSKTTSGLNISNKIDTTKDTSAKIVSSSAKPSSTIQSKIQNNTSLSKDKTPKSSANEIKMETSKSLQTKTADSSNIKVASSNTTEKQSNVNTKTTNKPLSTTTRTTKNDNTISTPNITKTVSKDKTPSNLPKSVTSAITSKSMTAPSTKSATKVTSVTSQKPQSSTVTSVTSTKPMGSGKTQLPASSMTSSVTRTSSVSASSNPVSSVPTSKPATTKSAPSSSTSETTSSVSVLPMSTSVTSANGIAKSDIMKTGSKSNDLAKDGKISKA